MSCIQPAVLGPSGDDHGKGALGGPGGSLRLCACRTCALSRPPAHAWSARHSSVGPPQGHKRAASVSPRRPLATRLLGLCLALPPEGGRVWEREPDVAVHATWLSCTAPTSPDTHRLMSVLPSHISMATLASPRGHSSQPLHAELAIPRGAQGVVYCPLGITVLR